MTTITTRQAADHEMKQLSLFPPFTANQQEALLAALAAQRWSNPDPWCRCDSCRHAREAEALHDGTMPEAERQGLAWYLWDYPGIFNPPGAYVDYDPFEELHRAIYQIRFAKRQQRRADMQSLVNWGS